MYIFGPIHRLVIVPIIKKGEEKVIEEHRRITLMATGYKVYMTVLAEKIRIVKEKKVIPHNQRGMGTIDNVYMLNYLVNKQWKWERRL